MKRRYKILNGILITFVLLLSTLAVVLSYNSDCTPAPGLSSDASAMNAVTYRCYGPTEVLEYGPTTKPEPADNEVLVKIHAAGVNPLDWHRMHGAPYIMRLGSGIGAPERNTMGADFSGEVEAVGKNVTRFKPGDSVFGGKSGAFAEYISIAEDKALVHKPANMSFEQAATVPVAALTALQALRDQGKIKAGDNVLINGASGGVGTFAVQIAKSFGATVTGVCSGRNVEMVRSIGADHVFNYKEEDYTESGQMYDLIIDNVGNHSISKNREVLKPDGTLVIVGGAKGNWLGPLITPIKAVMMSPFVEQELLFFVARLKQDDLAFIGELMQQGKITPVIDRQYSLAEVPQAVAYSETGRARGKIVITVD